MGDVLHIVPLHQLFGLSLILGDALLNFSTGGLAAGAEHGDGAFVVIACGEEIRLAQKLVGLGLRLGGHGALRRDGFDGTGNSGGIVLAAVTLKQSADGADRAAHGAAQQRQSQQAQDHEPDQGPVPPKLIGKVVLDPLGAAGFSAPTAGGIGAILLIHRQALLCQILL